MQREQILAQEYLRKLFNYHPSGRLIWRIRDNVPTSINTRFAGTYAGSFDNKGYVVIRVHNRIFKAHRLIWIWHNGPIPESMQIDHIDGQKANNMIENLRLANNSQNHHNLGVRSNNTSGIKGVYFDKARNKWAAETKAKGRKIFLGRYHTKEEAAKAYNEAAKFHHGEFYAEAVR